MGASGGNCLHYMNFRVQVEHGDNKLSYDIWIDNAWKKWESVTPGVRDGTKLLIFGGWG